MVAGLVFCLLFGSFGLFIAFSMARAANGRVGIQIAAASFGLAAVSAYCEAASVLLKGRTGPMPVPLSRRRPLAWVWIGLIAIGVLSGAAAIPR